MTATYANAGTRSSSSGATTRTPALPASLVNGDLLFAVAGAKNANTHTWSAGWTKIDQRTQGTFTVSLAVRVVDGSQVAPVISWTGTAACFAQCYAHFAGDTKKPIGAIIVNSGTGSTHTCPALASTQRDSRIIYIDAAAANTALATPTGRTENLDNGSATGATRNVIGGINVPARSGQAAAISVVGANAAWVMWQIELIHAASRQEVASTQYTSGESIIGPFSINDGDTEAELSLTRENWPVNAGTDAVSAILEISYDAELTWPVQLGFSAPGGSNTVGRGQVLTSNIASMPIPNGTGRRARIRFAPTRTINTSVMASVF